MAGSELKRVAVVGSRTFKDYRFLCEKLDAIRFLLGDFQVVSGGVEGADSLAVRWAKERGLVEPKVFQAEWDDLSHEDAVIRLRSDGSKYDAMAGPRRNQKIVDAAHVMVAFWDGKSRGTKDSILRARKAGIPVYVFYPERTPLAFNVEE